MARICWYCANALRENPSEVSCARHYRCFARTYVCQWFQECYRKKNASEEQLGI